MISAPIGVRVYLACGSTDMRKGMDGLAIVVQRVLAEDPFGGAMYAFRGRRGSLLKLLWHDGHVNRFGNYVLDLGTPPAPFPFDLPTRTHIRPATPPGPDV